MITLREVENAIAEYESIKNPTAAICAKLADLYIVRSNLLWSTNEYSQMASPVLSAKLELSGNSEFLSAVNGKDADSAWNIIDDLMDTLKVSYPRAYETVMRKLYNI